MGTVIDLNQHVLGACKDCGNTQWYIVLDKIEYTQLLGLKCVKCDAIISMDIKVGKENEGKRVDQENNIRLV